MTDHRTALAVTSLVLLAAGCGTASSTGGSGGSPSKMTSASATSTGSAGARPKPCALVSTTEAGAAFEVKMANTAKDVDNSIDTVCSYRDRSAGLSLDVLVRDYPVTADQLRTAAGDADPVPGIGDAAYWDAGRGTLTTTKGVVMIVLDVLDSRGSTSEATQRAAAEALARTAVGRF